jgi:ubiquitin carboxyl-terminal hydrolase 25/28
MLMECRLFYGKTKNVMSTTKGVKRGNEEWFSDIKINVASGPCDIYTALDGAFDEQEVQVDNASLLQYTTISQLPFVLQVFVQRSQWDHEKKVQYKVESFLAMEDVIYLDRYLDPSLNESSPDIGQLRQKAWDLKKKLSTLQQQKEALTKTDIDATIPDTLNGAKEFVKVYESIDIDDMVIIDQDVSRILEDAATQANQKLESINHNIQTFSSELNNLFAADRKVAYRLHAVFMHRGSSSFGHYWIYINDFRKNLWRKYNDSYVTEVDRKEVFEQEETRPATPYFLVYVRDDYKTELSDPLCRHIQPESGMAVEVDMVDQVQG